MTFLRQNSHGFAVWETPFEELRWPMLTNLRMDPFERAYEDSMSAAQPAQSATVGFCSGLTEIAAYKGSWVVDVMTNCDLPLERQLRCEDSLALTGTACAPHGNLI